MKGGFCAVGLPHILFYKSGSQTALPNFGAMSFRVNRMSNRSDKAVAYNGQGIKAVIFSRDRTLLSLRKKISTNMLSAIPFFSK